VFAIGFTWQLVGRFLLAAVLGALASAARARGGTGGADARTNAVLASGFCLFTSLSLMMPGGNTAAAAGLTVGAGLVAAGTLIKSESAARGLAAAADVWVIAAIGMASGIGMGWLALFVALFAAALYGASGPAGVFSGGFRGAMAKFFRTGKDRQEKEGQDTRYFPCA